MKKNPTHRAFYLPQGGVSPVGFLLDGLSKVALIDIVLDALEAQGDTSLEAARAFIGPRLAVRGDRMPGVEKMVKRQEDFREKLRRDAESTP